MSNFVLKEDVKPSAKLLAAGANFRDNISPHKNTYIFLIKTVCFVYILNSLISKIFNKCSILMIQNKMRQSIFYSIFNINR